MSRRRESAHEPCAESNNCLVSSSSVPLSFKPPLSGRLGLLSGGALADPEPLSPPSDPGDMLFPAGVLAGEDGGPDEGGGVLGGADASAGAEVWSA